VEETENDPKTMQDLTSVMQALLQQIQDKFQTISDQTIGRTDDVRAFPPDLMTQAGVKELDGENKTPAPQRSWSLLMRTRLCSILFMSQEKMEDGWLFATNYYV
uniref:Heat shock factor-binding protein 1 n=1 Tax=Bos indicus x Bos taurus TaxID=30522 RepID=A0A4W2E034_BOBOX